MGTLVASEIVKLRTTRLLWVLLAVSEFLVLLGILGTLVQGADLRDPQTAQEALTHVSLVALFTLVLGGYAVAGEYRHRTITDTYLGAPNRARVFLAKLFVTSAAGLLIGVIAAITGIAAASIGWAVEGVTLNLGEAVIWQTLVGGVLWSTAFAAIGVGLGAIIRNLTATVVIALAWLALVEGVVASVLGNLARWLPYRSGAALGNTAGTADALSQPAAGLVMLVYVALFAVIGVWATRRSDVV